MKFDLGRVVATPAALHALGGAGQDPLTLLIRHLNGDWGDVDRPDWQANDHALNHDGRLLSAYTLPDGTKVWIITEWDRSATTILLPDDY